MDAEELYRRTVQAWNDRVAAVPPDAWSNPTPCADWSVRELVNHVTYENKWAIPLFAGSSVEDVGDQFEGDLLGDDPATASLAAADDAVAAGIRLESGVVATLTISTNVWIQYTRVELHGTEGALVAQDTSPLGQGRVTLLREGAEPEDVTRERPNSWVAQLEEVTRAASGEDVPYASGEDGARNLEIMEQIIE